MDWSHVSDHDLQRYYLGMVEDEAELAALEEHILACAACAERAEEAQDFIDAMRAAALDWI
jgi:anti-sigma factor RsiW